MEGWRLCPALLLGLALLAGCEASDPPPAVRETADAAPTLPMPDPPLDREALLLAVAGAASDWAAGTTDLETQRELDGKRFEIKLRFGCPGEVSSTRRWSFDENERVLRARVEHELTIAAPLVAELGIDGFEAAEGFWVRRPWLLEAVCPARRPSGEPEHGRPSSGPEQPDQTGGRAVSAPMIGIAQFFTSDDSRAQRRDARDYEATVKLGQGEAPSSAGYDLVLSGRLARLPDGRVIACAGAYDAHPDCVISVRFDQAALARPDGEVLAQWSSG